jgi:isoleucyl-tRNA synthetase
LGEDGREMHKSWGNMIEFNEAADRIGVDVMRWLFCDHKPEKDLRFGYHRADEARRQFLLPLWNVYNFFVTYARIDGWDPGVKKETALSQLDRWILARLQTVVGQVTRSLEDFEPDLATEAVNLFLDQLSNWYLRRSRRRFWAKSGASDASDADKQAAYATLYQVLTTLTRLMAPFVPFVTEVIYQNLVRAVDPDAPESVHHCMWPKVDEGLEDRQLSHEMDLVMRLVSLGHAARNASGLKVRQPLAEAAFGVGAAEERQVLPDYSDLIADELNVKRVRLLEAASEVVDYRLNPLPRQLGQKHGSRFPAIREAILALPAAEAANRILSGQSIAVDVYGELMPISPDEVEVRIEPHAGLSAVADGPYLAALSTELTPELEQEGLAREFVRRVQDFRKQNGLEIDDHIDVIYSATPRLKQAIEAFSDYIRNETLAESLVATEELPAGEKLEDEFGGQRVGLSIVRSA